MGLVSQQCHNTCPNPSVVIKGAGFVLYDFRVVNLHVLFGVVGFMRNGNSVMEVIPAGYS